MSGTRHDRIIAFIVALAALAVFAGALNGSFVYDDVEYVTDNVAIHGGLSLAMLRWALTSTYASNWHPLTWLSHGLDVSLYGMHPLGHHLTSLLLHALNAALLFLVLRRLTGFRGRSAAVALLFALHPLRVESVAWVSERKDLLSALMLLLALGAWLAFLRRREPGRYLGALGLFALALAAKPMVVTFPCLLLLLDFWPLGRIGWWNKPGAIGQRGRGPSRLTPRARGGWWLLVEKVPFFLAAAASSAVTIVAQGTGDALQALSGTYSGAARLSNALVAWAAYLGKAFWPAGLAIFYPHPGEGLPLWKPIAAGLLVLLASGLALRLARRAPWFAVGWFWYAGMLVPVIGLVQAGWQAMADRYSYLPLVGVAIALVWAAGEAGRRFPRVRRAALPLLCGILVILSVLSILQVRVWRNQETLFRHATLVTEGNFIAWGNLGAVFTDQGRVAEALDALRRAVAIRPDYAGGWYNMGVLLSATGDQLGAFDAYRRAVMLRPHYYQAHNNLGAVLVKLGDLTAAEAEFREALRYQPNDDRAYGNLGVVLAARGDRAGAIAAYRRSLALAPDNDEVRGRLAEQERQ